jgi:hypothetical protein
MGWPDLIETFYGTFLDESEETHINTVINITELLPD